MVSLDDKIYFLNEKFYIVIPYTALLNAEIIQLSGNSSLEAYIIRKFKSIKDYLISRRRKLSYEICKYFLSIRVNQDFVVDATQAIYDLSSLSKTKSIDLIKKPMECFITNDYRTINTTISSRFFSLLDDLDHKALKGDVSNSYYLYLPPQSVEALQPNQVIYPQDYLNLFTGAFIQQIKEKPHEIEGFIVTGNGNSIFTELMHLFTAREQQLRTMSKLSDRNFSSMQYIISFMTTDYKKLNNFILRRITRRRILDKILQDNSDLFLNDF